jgi:Protein of unknown function (DUF1579)
MRSVNLLMLLAVLGVCCFGQESATTNPAPVPSATKAFSSAPQSPEMKKMVDAFAGRWRVTISVEKMPGWFPIAGTAIGRSDIQAGPAGNSLSERLHSNGPLGDFAGNGIYWYDAQSKSYKGIWCDSMDPTGCSINGTANWEGSNFVVNNEISMGAQGKLRIRETYSNITHDSFDFAIESAMGDSPLAKVMSIRYERGAGAKVR